MNCIRFLYIGACAIGMLLFNCQLATGQLIKPKNASTTTQSSTATTTPTPKTVDKRTPSEKMMAKRWTWKRKFFQDMTTRYNYYYHAKLQLAGILDGINQQRVDNYAAFLPFYPYSPESLNLNQSDLDSVIQRASIAIHIHDPRGKWIDDCYFIIGKAYYYKTDWENATKTFQYINTTFAPKKKKEYKTVIGTNTDNQLSIATREKRKGFFGKFKHPASRNDAFLWQAKVHLEQEQYDDAQSLLNVLTDDPYFPKRLKGNLAEMKAFQYYKQQRYNETVEPLKIAIKHSDNRNQRARMYFILGQIYASQKKFDSSLYCFQKVIDTKPDALMDFQARLQVAKANILSTGGTPEQSIEALQRMLRKENFIPYKDIIYYTMAEIALEKDPGLAETYLQKALTVESNNQVQRAVTYKALADMRYGAKNFAGAKVYYDSVAAIMPPDFVGADIVNARKDVLSQIDAHIKLIRQEDSLQQIAKMDPSARNVFLEKRLGEIKNTARMRANQANNQQQGNYSNYVAPNAAVTQQRLINSNPFYRNNPQNGSAAGGYDDGSGDWYFYNQVTKSSGLQEFKKRWGNRAPVDNWRRSSAAGLAGAPKGNNEPLDMSGIDSVEAQLVAKNLERLPADSITVDMLVENLPLTGAQMDASKRKQQASYYDLGKLYSDKLENYKDGIKTYDTLLQRYPAYEKKPEVLYSLYVWNNKINNPNTADLYKNQLLNQFGHTNYATLIKVGKIESASDDVKKGALALYDSAYINYLSGNYSVVIDNKRQADSLYKIYPHQAQFDLLEGMALVKLGDEENGKKAIANVITKYPADDAIINQAQGMLNVLDRKQEIVGYLSSLQNQPIDAKNTAKVDENVTMRYPWQNPQPNLVDSAAVKKAFTDSVAKNAPAIAAAPAAPVVEKPVTPYKLGPEDLKAANPHFVVLSFKRVEKALIDEGVAQFSKYNAEKHVNDKIEASSFVLTPTEVMLIFRLFPNEQSALDYLEEIEKQAPTTIIPRIKPVDYTLFIISRDNFILLNTTKDIEGYKKFFLGNYQ
ncbi:tetratricopeptide repeat protein [Chitinophaga skermanii]|uniref:Tetratricopeptide repeat protein n=1 Tax=Chitinophaga skermanii TaxID=331697 RepID=A0A327Q537_9BACT|nr:hypothetical protein [Chitinophaga skermanii]RAI99430.1 tetratricopeptide repeat protein [Chitinophaga skermanii]